MKEIKILIFLHIIKAGGTTLHSILENQYDGVKNIVSNGFKTLDEIRLLSLEERSGIGVYRGHMNYGLHKQIPRPSVYITMLRNPVDRVISHYYYAKKDICHPLHELCLSGLSLEDFVCESTDNDNGQVRALAGIANELALFNEEEEIPFGACDEKHLDLAKRNLANFASFGLIERFNESLILMKRTLGWQKPPVYIKKNVNEHKLTTENIHRETLDIIEKNNVLDMELYTYALALFDERLRSLGDIFAEEVQSFEIINKVFGDYYDLKKHLQITMADYQTLMADYQTLKESRAVKLAEKLENHPLLFRISQSAVDLILKRHGSTDRGK